MIDEEEIYPIAQSAPWACSLCGGTSWPEQHTECPLCRDTEDEE
jgi:rubrerythrin